MSTLNNLWTTREVEQEWAQQLAHWHMEQSIDDEAQKLRAETMRTPGKRGPAQRMQDEARYIADKYHLGMYYEDDMGRVYDWQEDDGNF